MLLGIDVGGTHTDAALVDEKSGRCLFSVKVPTRVEDVLPGLLEALEKVLEGQDATTVQRLCISSTLGLNALLTGTGAVTGMLVVAGPGITPKTFWHDDPLFVCLQGAQDHRGTITAHPGETAIRNALESLKKRNIEALGIVCKFSPKNPELEQELGTYAREILGEDIPLILGSSVSGSLNFPRRMHTAWCNAALSGSNQRFLNAIDMSARKRGITCPLVVLKADAGVFTSGAAMKESASCMGSGPAAGLLGVWATTSQQAAASDALMVDMGGTTTDLALLANGQPLLARTGLQVGWRPTLIRSLWTRSLALGGNSILSFVDGALVVGGVATSADQRVAGSLPSIPLHAPTLTDALNVLGLASHGDVGASRIKMEAFVQQVPQEIMQKGTLPTASVFSPMPDERVKAGHVAEFVARLAVETVLLRIQEEAKKLQDAVNEQPVYTIREMLVEAAIQPACVYFVGGPATSLASAAQEIWNMPVEVPAMSACTNAVGAALARPTLAAELYADTQVGRMVISALEIEEEIDTRYGAEQATHDLVAALQDAAGETAFGAAQITGLEDFAVINERGGRDRIIRVRAQMPAGLLCH